MVCCTAWSDDTKPNLFTCGFDKNTFGWTILQQESSKENEFNSNSSFKLSFQPS